MKGTESRASRDASRGVQRRGRRRRPRELAPVTAALAGALLALLVGPGPAGAAGEGAGHGEQHSEAEPHAVAGEHPGAGEQALDAVSLTAAEIAEFGIEIAPATAGTIEVSVALPGEVQPNADRLAHIVPRYSGIVIEVRANIGDTVDRGQVLAIIESDESLAPFELKTLISGTVIEKHITLGEAVSRETEGFVIADLGTVWIDLTVYQKDLDRVQTGQHVVVFTGHETRRTTGTISYITPVVDEATRTATARVVLPNPDGSWRPGRFVTGRVRVAQLDAAVAVPRTALQSVEEQTVVFVQTGGGFRPQPVELGRADATLVEIRAGLEPGTPIVSRGGFTLKAELAKEAFASGHAH